MKRFITCIALALLPLAAQAQNYSDIWWNAGESGWGLTIADHETQLFAVWFTYRQDGRPTWFVIPGGTFTGNHTHFVGDVYATTGPAYSNATFDPARVTATKVGTATIDFSSYSAATFTYSVNGVTQTKAISRQPFGNGSPVWGNDVSDIWYNPAESGWGLTLAQHGNNVFGVWFTYDTDGQPLWSVMPGVSFDGDHGFTGQLFTTTGPAFSNPSFDSSQVVAKLDGTATFSWTKGTASAQCGGNKAGTLQTTLRGASRSSSACQQPFGNVATLPTFARNSAPAGAALFSAPANPINATISTDDSASVSQLITAASGGTMSLTDARGNKFTLAFPPNALGADTTVTMTAVRAVSGPTYASGVAFGLKLEPDGLELLGNALLTLVPAQAFPLVNQTGFAADGNGNDLHRAPPGPDFSQIQLSVGHFSFWGWLFMTPAERAAESRFAQAVANDARLWDQITGYLVGLKQKEYLGILPDDAPPPGADQVAEWMNQYYRDVVTPYLDAAGQSCFAAKRAYATATKYFNARKTLGIFDDSLSGTFVTDLGKVATGFNAARAKTPCYFMQTGRMVFPADAGQGTARITAHWRVEEQTGNAIKYVPFDGVIELHYPTTPDCTIPTAYGVPGTKDGFLNVDWGPRTWNGAALQLVPITIICAPDPPEKTQLPVFYFGDMGNLPTGIARGNINVNGGITEESHSLEGTTTTYSFTTSCDAGHGIFCGIQPVRPPGP